MWFLYDEEEDDSDYKWEEDGDSDVEEDGDSDEVMRDGCNNREPSALGYYCAFVCS